MRRGFGFEHERESGAVRRGAQHQILIGQRQLPVDVDVERFPALLERPSEHHAARQAIADADVLAQLTRGLRRRMGRQVFRRCDHSPAQARAEGDGRQIGRHAFAKTDSGIETARR